MLAEIFLINDLQLVNLKTYLDKYKVIYSLFELKNIPGFDIQTIERMKPFIAFKKSQSKESYSLKKAFKYGRHQIIARYVQVIEPARGYVLPADSAFEKPGSNYLGKAYAYYLRYGFNYKNKIRFGFTLDRDAGELIMKESLNDSLKAVIGKKITNFIDFYSAYAYVSKLGILKKAVIGDYHLEFGQGLIMWSGLAFGKSAQVLQIKRFGKGIRPNTSANENRFFRGGAATIGWKGISMTAFYSNNNIDANLNHSSLLGEDEFTSMQETGKHRTINELLSKDALNIQVMGGRLAYRFKFFDAGITAFNTKLGAAKNKGDELYKLFNLNGNTLTNLGLDLGFTFGKVSFFGEIAFSDPGGFAGIAGINIFPADRFQFTVVYHNYGRDYHNLFANPFAESSATANEEGLYFGFKALLAKHISLTVYIDHFRFPWLRYRTDSPSIGRDYLAQLNIIPGQKAEIYFRYRYRHKQENYQNEYEYFADVYGVSRHEFRFNLSYRILDFLVLKNRVEYIIFLPEKRDRESGYMIYQDILYRPKNFKLEASFRFCLFDTEGFNSRIYTYENDVLYSFSVPSFFDVGQRYYLMIRYKALKQLDIWFRFSRTTYQNRSTIGSGADEIDGNKRTEVKIQLIFKL